MDIKYDIPIEITKQQFIKIIPMFNGYIAWRKIKDGKYEIKLWFMKYKKELQNRLL